METPIKIPRDNKSLYFLYRTVTGRVMLKFLTLRSVSKIAGIYMESAASANLINGFIKKTILICLNTSVKITDASTIFLRAG